jgi:glycosyltransferase A (GT-A) superfamily protein (DUF2064 family)
MNTVINILSKNPEQIECKTRLKPFLSKDERTYISKIMLKMTCKAISKMDVEKRLYLYPNVEGEFIKRLSGDFKFNLLLQDRGFLSDKIYSVLNAQDQKISKRILVGSDIPSISSYDFEDCISLLEKYDIVFGPSKDGGFYFVGVKNNAHEVFKHLSLNHIPLDKVIEECSRYKFDYKLTRQLKDIDSVDDLLFIR